MPVSFSIRKPDLILLLDGSTNEKVFIISSEGIALFATSIMSIALPCPPYCEVEKYVFVKKEIRDRLDYYTNNLINFVFDVPTGTLTLLDDDNSTSFIGVKDELI